MSVSSGNTKRIVIFGVHVGSGVYEHFDDISVSLSSSNTKRFDGMIGGTDGSSVEEQFDDIGASVCRGHSERQIIVYSHVGPRVDEEFGNVSISVIHDIEKRIIN